MELNERQIRLKQLIDDGHVPEIIDATAIWDRDPNANIPYHWGDIEVIGYGKTSRVADRWGDVYDWSRNYTGPGKILLSGFGEMVAGDWSD